MNIKIGQIFRYSVNSVGSNAGQYVDFYSLTKGRYLRGVGAGGKGIFHYSAVKEPNTNFSRIPAFILHSNPLKEDSDDTPWIDSINTDEGYAIYNGDNKSSRKSAFESSGNKTLMSVIEMYKDPKRRIYAPPLVLFKQERVGNKKKGYRSFQGYGIITQVYIRTQKEKGTELYFTNLVFEIRLFNLDYENDTFSWKWIDKRRDQKSTSFDCLNYAPKAWKLWVQNGNEAIEKIQRRVSKNLLVRVSEQQLQKKDLSLLQKIYKYYNTDKTRHHFEGLASAVSFNVIGGKISRGWVTPRSGDGGIDFVNRFELGDEFSKTSIVVLGQAKCIKPESSISGHDLARVVARLQRGWIGVFVTTGTFSNRAQIEMLEDKYPIILINGKRLVQEVRKMLNIDNISLIKLLDRESDWYEKNISLEPASKIIYKTLNTMLTI